MIRVQTSVTVNRPVVKMTVWALVGPKHRDHRIDSMPVLWHNPPAVAVSRTRIVEELRQGRRSNHLDRTPAGWFSHRNRP